MASGLGEELITQSNGSHRVCLIVRDIETSTTGRPKPIWAVGAQGKKKSLKQRLLSASTNCACSTVETNVGVDE